MSPIPSLGNTLDEIWRAWRDLRPISSCQTVVGTVVCGEGTYDFRAGALHWVFAPTPRSLASVREATQSELGEVEEAITRGWLQITDQPVSGVRYGESRAGFGTRVLHQATGRRLPPLTKESSIMQMDESQPGPPEEVETARRDMEYMRRCQERWKDGYRSRMCEDQPERPTGRNLKGEDVLKVDQHASLSHLAQERCPKEDVDHLVKTGPIRYGEKSRTAVPTHERERWMAGYLHADALVVKHGRTRVSSDPTYVKRKAKQVAPTVEMFPNAVLTKEEVKALKAAAKRPAYGDAGEQT